MKIALSKGHNVYNNGRFDNGASGYKVEAAEVDKTVDILVDLLRAKGHQVEDITPKNERFAGSKQAHEERARRVNRLKPDLYLDIHLNSGGGAGTECWVYRKSGLAYEYAKKINKSIAKNTGLRNRGEKVNTGMWSLRMTNCPALIVEGAFVDSKRDMAILTPELYAKSIADAFPGEVSGLTRDDVIEIIKEYEEERNNSPQQKWSNEAIEFVVDKKIMKGYEDGSFKPNKPVTRAELAQVLYNLK